MVAYETCHRPQNRYMPGKVSGEPEVLYKDTVKVWRGDRYRAILLGNSLGINCRAYIERYSLTAVIVL